MAKRPLGQNYHDGCSCVVTLEWASPQAGAPAQAATSTGGITVHQTKPKSSWYELHDADGNVIGPKVQGKAKAEAKAVELASMATPGTSPAAGLPAGVADGGLSVIKPNPKSSWHHIVDAQGNVVEKVNGKAKAEARLAELAASQPTPGAAPSLVPPLAGDPFGGITIEQTKPKSPWYELFDADGNSLGKVQGKAKAEAKALELAGTPASPASVAPAAPAPNFTAAHKGGGQWEIFDAQGNKVDQVKGKAAAEARIAELSAAPEPTRPRPARPTASMPRHSYADYSRRRWHDKRQQVMGENPAIGDSIVVHEETEGTLKSWLDSLTDSEREAVRRYTTEVYLVMNDAMVRSGGSTDPQVLLRAISDELFRSRSSGMTKRQIADAIPEIASALAKHPDRAEPVAVFRGLHPDKRRGFNPRAIYEPMQVGDEFDEQAFLSTGLQEAVSENFAGRTEARNEGNSVMLEIQTRAGANIIQVSTLGEMESEVLLPPSRFRVTRPYDPVLQKIWLEVVD